MNDPVTNIGRADDAGRASTSRSITGCFTKKLRNHPALLFLFIASWMSLEYVALGPASFVRIHDTGDSFIPRYEALGNGMKEHGITYWVPWMACGVDRLCQDLRYSQPGFLLSHLLPGWAGYQAFMFGSFFISGYFVFRLCRDRLALQYGPAVFAGIAFIAFVGQEGFLHFQLGIVGFPALLWTLEALRPKVTDLFFTVPAVLALGVATGVATSVVWSLPFVFIQIGLWFFFVRRERRYRFWLSLLLLFLAAVCIHTQEIAALLLHTRSSQRSVWDYSLYLTGGIVSTLVRPSRKNWPFFCFALFGLARSGFRDPHFKACFFLFLLCTVGAGAIRVAQGLLMIVQPLFGGFQFDRIYEFAPFYGALASALGMSVHGGEERGLIHYLIQIPPRVACTALQAAHPLHRTIRRVWCWLFKGGEVTGGVAIALPPRAPVVLGLACVMLATILQKYEHAKEWYYDGSYAANYRSPVLKELSDRRSSDNMPWRVATFAWQLHPAYANAYNLETADGYINLYPRRFHTFWSKLIEPLTERNPDINRYFNLWGNRVYLFGDNPGELNLSDFFHLRLLSLANTKYIISACELKDDRLLLIHRGAQDPVDRKTKIRTRLRRNFSGRTSLYLYENKECFPRFFLAGNVRFFPDARSLFDALAKAESATIRSTVFLEEAFRGAVEANAPAMQHSSIHLDGYSPDAIVLSLDVRHSSVLVASNSYSPYWRCRVDGRLRDLFPAYGTFWGVQVHPADRTLEFTYEPPYAYRSGWLLP